jgi:hypothetical protein
MTIDDFILTVFCLVDDLLKQLHLQNVRQRGPQPKLHDSEVLTIEIVGEFLEIDKDCKIFWHFRRYHADAFPGLRHIDRSTFVRQAANLWVVKQKIHQHLVEWLTGEDRLWHVDSMPVYACQFARAPFCERFAGEAAFGKDHLIRQTFYGFRLHLRCSSEGVIQSVMLAPANAPETAVIWELALRSGSVGIGDRGYWSPTLTEALAEHGVWLLAPYKKKSEDPDAKRSRRISRCHWLVETVNSQLAERYNIKRTWARDLWHVCHRIIRKVLSHTVAVWVCLRSGLPPLQHANLITD